MGARRKQTVTGNASSPALAGLPRAGLVLAASLSPAPALAASAEAGDALNFLATLFYSGFIVALLLRSLLQFLTTRDSRYLEHSIFAFALGIAQFALGTLHSHLPGTEPGEFISLAQPLGLALAGVSGALLARGFLHSAKGQPRLDLTLRILAGLSAAAGIAAFVLPPAQSVAVAAGIGLALTLAVILGALEGLRVGIAGARLVLAGWGAFGANMLLLAAHAGLSAEPGPLALHGMHLASSAAVLLLSLALAERTGAKWRERAIRHAEELASAEHMIESLQASEQFLTQSMAQRGVELDILTQRLQESEQRFQQMSHHDPLTGLANQLLLADRIDQGIIRAKRHNTRTGVIVVDLDEFGALNEAYGKEIGDEILRTVALRLRSIVREQDTVARPEDDQFVLVLEEVFDADDLQRVANGITIAVAEPMQIAGQTFVLDASIGCAISTSEGSSTTLLKQAGKLMRRAKEGKRLNRHHGGVALPQG